MLLSVHFGYRIRKVSSSSYGQKVSSFVKWSFKSPHEGFCGHYTSTILIMTKNNKNKHIMEHIYTFLYPKMCQGSRSNTTSCQKLFLQFHCYSSALEYKYFLHITWKYSNQIKLLRHSNYSHQHFTPSCVFVLKMWKHKTIKIDSFRLMSVSS